MVIHVHADTGQLTTHTKLVEGEFLHTSVEHIVGFILKFWLFSELGSPCGTMCVPDQGSLGIRLAGTMNSNSNSHSIVLTAQY